MNRGPSTRRLTLVLAGVAALVLIVALVASFGGGGSSGPSTFTAEIMCERFINDQLKAPATADYTHETSAVIDEDSVAVAGYVDAENGFGANIRTRYVCEVTNTTGDRWTLDDLTMN